MKTAYVLNVILSPWYSIKHSISCITSHTKKTYESYTFKWMFMYDSHVKSKEKMLA